MSSRWTEEDLASHVSRLLKTPIAPQAVRKAPRSYEEDDLQMSFVAWCLIMEKTWLDLALAFHPANGGKRAGKEYTRKDGTKGRYSPEAKRLKAMGVRPSVPDWILPCARGGYIGLAIEFKSTSGRMRPDQTAYCNRLEVARWKVYREVKEIEVARAAVKEYFSQ